MIAAAVIYTVLNTFCKDIIVVELHINDLCTSISLHTKQNVTATATARQRGLSLPAELV